ncbi:MAG TPA: hypothetical protein PLZ98_07090, partial [Chitinophagaceae bacterium]|nr:hypothetical protein [Chitinophagaceae bacterium]
YKNTEVKSGFAYVITLKTLKVICHKHCVLLHFNCLKVLHNERLSCKSIKDDLYPTNKLK